MTAVIVDWLGRGGIAQCSEAWALELGRAGIETVVITRPGRELGEGRVEVEAAPQRASRLAAHRAMVRHAARTIEHLRPDTVVVQNHVIPLVETPVYEAARRVGARLVLVVHDHRLHSRTAGIGIGLSRLMRRADTVLAHTRSVAAACARRARCAVRVVPHPVPIGLVTADRAPVPFSRDRDRLLALHFGVLRRGYKGTGTVVDLARLAPPGWQIAVAGVGAPMMPGLVGVSRFLAPGELAAAVEASDVTLLPYRFATQSGAVVLAQVLGSVAVVTAVGGTGEQVADGQTGRLLPVGATAQTWAAVLEELRDDGARAGIRLRARQKAWDDHHAFRRAAVEIVRGAADRGTAGAGAAQRPPAAPQLDPG